MANLRSHKVQIKVAGANDMPAYIAIPEGAGPFPSVLVFEEIFGVNSHIRDVTDRVAQEGYVAISFDYHHRAWPPGTELGYDDAGMKRGMEVIPKLSADGLRADIDATLAFLKNEKAARTDKLGAIGFCIGGHMAYYAAEHWPISATASFYGGGIATFGPSGEPTVKQTSRIKGKILCLFGKQDTMIPQDQVATIRAALEQARVRHEIVVYDDATHGFFCDQRGSYNPNAAADAWGRVKRLFAEELR